MNSGRSKVERAMHLVKWYEAEAGLKKRERLPISSDLLKSVWEQDAENPDKAMLWAACSFVF